MNSKQSHRGLRFGWLIRASFILSCGAITGFAEPRHTADEARIIAEQAYDAAKSRYQTNRSDAEATWQFGRASFELADLADKDSKRAALGHEGEEACRDLLRRDPNSAAAHYYLGMNLGQIAQTKSLGALSLVRQMQKEWEAARVLGEHIDYAGPDRNLGMLYRDAPGAPLSIGSRAKAMDHLVRAVELEPGYPENHLNLIESDIKWNRMAEADRENERLLTILASARQQLTGLHWQGPWQDWDDRLEDITKKLSKWRNSTSRRKEP